MSNSETDKNSDPVSNAGVVSANANSEEELDDNGEGIKIFNTDRPTGLMSGFGDVSRIQVDY